MKLNPSLPTQKALVQGIEVNIPILLEEDALAPCAAALEAVSLTTAIAVSMINQTFTENVVNGTAKEVKEIIAKLLATTSYNWDGKLSSLDDSQKSFVYQNIDREEVQAKIDAFVQAYVPGTRRSAPAETLDPVDSEARSIAREAVFAALANTPFSWEGVAYEGVGKTLKAASFKAFDAYCKERFDGRGAHEIIAAKAAELVESDPFYRQEAERRLSLKTVQIDLFI